MLEVFYEREGHCLFRSGHKEDDFKLAIWVSRQRSSKDSLSPDRIERLDALGFVWDPITEQWEEGFSKLLKFHKREGHCLVTAVHKEDGYNLGSWVSNQRRRKDSLSPYQIERLDALGFVWDPFTEQWEEGFSKLLKFHKREGHCLVRQRHKEDDFRLGSWVLNQRTAKDSMSAERKQRLDDLGFIWKVN